MTLLRLCAGVEAHPHQQKAENADLILHGEDQDTEKGSLCLKGGKSSKMHATGWTFILFVVCLTHCWNIAHTQYLFAK